MELLLTASSWVKDQRLTTGIIVRNGFALRSMTCSEATPEKDGGCLRKLLLLLVTAIPSLAYSCIAAFPNPVRAGPFDSMKVDHPGG